MIKHRGGVLLDVFFIVVLCAGGFLAWKHREDLWKRASRFWPACARPASSQPVWQKPQNHLQRSAKAQAATRRFLDDVGLKERDLVKSWNQEYENERGRWLESTMEFNLPNRFNTGVFLEKLGAFLNQEGLFLMTDQNKKNTWLIELGDKQRVFQRVIVNKKGDHTRD